MSCTDVPVHRDLETPLRARAADKPKLSRKSDATIRRVILRRVRKLIRLG
jgi:hypothetical protein